MRIFEDILSVWRGENALLDDFKKFMPHITIHERPEVPGGFPEPIYIGARSLQCRVFETGEAIAFRRILATQLPDYSRRARRAQLDVVNSWRPAAASGYIRVEVNKRQKSLSYNRIIIPVRTKLGRSLVITKSLPISVN